MSPGIDRACFDEDVSDLAPIAAGIHDQRAADGARNGTQEFQPGYPGIRCGACDRGIERGGAHA